MLRYKALKANLKDGRENGMLTFITREVDYRTKEAKLQLCKSL